MVFSANAGLVIDGRVLAARFRHDERRGEELPYRQWFARHGYEVRVAEHVNEGEGDFLVAGELILAGAGFRTVPEAHAEVAEYFERPVVSLELVDPRYYHLDTALCVLDEHTLAYYPHAFSDESKGVLRDLFPDAIQASAADAAVLGLNATSNGIQVVLPAGAPGLSAQLAERGYEPVPVDMSELRKAGGAAKCCSLELRPLEEGPTEGVMAR
jgi:N-dimethylarginine dimethylaminohydrolase